MKRVMMVLVAVWLIHLTGIHGWSQDLAGPVAAPAETEYTFEPVAEGTKVTHVFSIRNRGDALLKIENVKTG